MWCICDNCLLHIYLLIWKLKLSSFSPQMCHWFYLKQTENLYIYQTPHHNVYIHQSYITSYAHIRLYPVHFHVVHVCISIYASSPQILSDRHCKRTAVIVCNMDHSKGTVNAGKGICTRPLVYSVQHMIRLSSGSALLIILPAFSHSVDTRSLLRGIPLPLFAYCLLDYDKMFRWQQLSQLHSHLGNKFI